MPEPVTWSGQCLAGDTLAAVVRPGTDWDLDVQCGERPWHVPESRLGDFLIRHANRRFACHHAGEFHGALERTLGKNEAAAKAALWALSRDGRLIDVSLLAILVRDAKQWSPHEQSESPEPQLFEPGALLARTRDLLQQASEVSRGLNGADGAKGFGPLGLALEVQARIAAYQMSRAGLRICTGAREILKQACENRYAVLDRMLRKDPAARIILRVPNVQRNAEAPVLPIRQSKKLRAWLVTIASSLCDIDEIPIPIPVSQPNQELPASQPIQIWPVSQRYQDWRDYADTHPLVGGWIELMDVCTLLRFFRSRVLEEIHPQYSSLECLEAVEPRIQLIPTLKCPGPVFRPRSGHHFVVARLERLTQRCLGHVLGGLDAQSAFASALNQTGGPEEHLALRLREFGRSGDIAGAASFPEDSWRHIGREILELASMRNSPEAIRLRLEREGVRLNDREVHKLLKRTVVDVYPELGRYLRCSVQERIANKLGITEDAWTKSWTELFGDAPDPAKLGRTFFGQFSLKHRYRYDTIARMLARLNVPHSEIPPPLTRPELYRFLTGQTFVGPTGRVCGNANLWDTQGKYHIILADAVRKKAAYELTRSGLTVCGIFGDSILVEASSSWVGSDTYQTVEAALQPVLKGLLGELPGSLALETMREFPALGLHATEKS